MSETTSGRAAQDRFRFSATVELFEECGSSRIRQVGKHAWTVGRTGRAGVRDPAARDTWGPTQ